ncbi:unnamed protein product [Durusdinium trenchii]|uniref:EF-hand domain-containing protein n=2 Tax=Durusdinium trenchii TaxID=1381693 RepID=A0ABP0MT20_9DINO
MTAMDKESYAQFLDASLLALRNHLLAAYPEPSSARWAELESSFEGIRGGLPSALPALPLAAAASGATTPRDLSPVSRESSSVRFQEIPEETRIEPILPVELEEKDAEEVNTVEVAAEDEDSDNEPEAIGHGDSSRFLQSDLSDLTEAERRSIRHRLRIRLGHVTANKLVTGKSLHDAMCALGLTRYKEDEMNDFLNHLATFLDLSFESPEDRNELTWSGASLAFFTRLQEDVRDLKPVWEWPTAESNPSLHREYSKSSTMGFNSDKAVVAKHLVTFNVAPAQAVMEIFLAHEGSIHKKIFGPKLFKQFKAMREVLMAGDTNRLVAELTFVRINDLAAPPEPIHILMYLEPLIAVIIIANGVMIGFQTDPYYEDWSGWIYMECVFAGLLLLEICLRFIVIRCRDFWCGAERLWNLFDLFLCSVAFADIIIQTTAVETPKGTTLLRFFRLIRLARIVRVFRLKVMKDLRLMLRGLVAGCWTLALSFVLLFAVLYVIAGLANLTMGSSDALMQRDLTPYFYNIPAAMFTTFRCTATGECVTEAGISIPTALAKEFGWPFVLGYVASYMLVTMGISNVILAVYVDITMKAAKENDAVTAEQYARESIRVARATRELLKKFAAAYHTWHVEDHETLTGHLEIKETAALFTDDEIHDNIEISKELFLMVVHDRGAQELMDDLDLPVNRAHLFEVIDADGSGSLHIQELVQGLLKIRGEANKGDTIAPLLAARAVQQKIETLREEFTSHFDVFSRKFTKEMQQHESFIMNFGREVRGSSNLPSPLSSELPTAVPAPSALAPPAGAPAGDVALPRAGSQPLEQIKAPVKPLCVDPIDEPPQHI